MPIVINGNGTISGLTLAASSMPSGSIIQTKSFIYTNTTQSYNSAGWHATPVTVQITPTSASNKILVMATLSAGNAGSGEGAAFKVMRSVAGGSYVETDSLGDAAGSANRGAVGGLYDENLTTHTDCRSIQFVDNPATTSAIDYKLYLYLFNGAVPALLNRPNTTTANEHITGASSIILMEVAA